MPDAQLSPGASRALGINTLGDDDLGARFSQAAQQNSDAMARVQQATQQKDAALAPVQAKIEAAQPPAPPKYDPLPQFVHQAMNSEQMQTTMQQMFALAAIGGAMTRQPMTAALNAFSAGIQGVIDGDHAVFQREAAEFDRNLKVAIQKNNQAHQEYIDAYEKYKGDLGKLMNEWKLIAAKHNDTITAAQIEANNAKDMMKHIESLDKATREADKTRQMLATQWARLSETMRHNQAMEAAAKLRAQRGAGGTNTRNMLVQSAGKNALARLNEMRGPDGSFPTTSVMFGQHGDGVISRGIHAVGQAALSDQQQAIDAGYSSLVDEAIPVFTGGLRGSDAFRKFLLGQVPQPGDAPATANEKMRLFEANINGTLNTFASAFQSNPSFHAEGEAAGDSDAPLTPAEEQELEQLRAKHGRK